MQQGQDAEVEAGVADTPEVEVADTLEVEVEDTLEAGVGAVPWTL